MIFRPSWPIAVLILLSSFVGAENVKTVSTDEFLEAAEQMDRSLQKLEYLREEAARPKPLDPEKLVLQLIEGVERAEKIGRTIDEIIMHGSYTPTAEDLIEEFYELSDDEEYLFLDEEELAEQRKEKEEFITNFAKKSAALEGQLDPNTYGKLTRRALLAIKTVFMSYVVEYHGVVDEANEVKTEDLEPKDGEEKDVQDMTLIERTQHRLKQCLRIQQRLFRLSEKMDQFSKAAASITKSVGDKVGIIFDWPRE